MARTRHLASGNAPANATTTVYTAPSGIHTRVTSVKLTGGAAAGATTILGGAVGAERPVGSATGTSPTEAMAVPFVLEQNEHIQLTTPIATATQYYITGTEYPT